MPATKKSTPMPARTKAALNAKVKKQVEERDALKAATAKADKAAAPKRDRSKWSDSTGHIIEKGVTVKADGQAVGTAQYFHTHEVEGKPVGMVGVKLTGKGDLLKVGGRSVKNRSYRADALTVVPE